MFVGFYFHLILDSGKLGTMSFNNIPSKMEVMNWDPAHLADFLRRRELTGCDKVIMKCNMNGQRFLNMTENDLQKFPNLYSPIISKICREINKKEEKRSIFPKRNPAPKFQETVEVGHDEQGWDSEEFESDDYESPDSHDEGGGSGDYESATEAGGESDNDYEPPPSEPSDDLQHPHIRPSKPIGNSEYIDRPGTSVKSQPPVPPARPGPGPPLPTTGRPSIPGGFKRTDHSPQRPQKPPPPDRSKKPSTLERGSNLMPVQGENFTSERNAPLPKRPGGVDKFPDPQRMPKPPVPGLGGTGVRRAVSSVTPGHSYNRHAPNPRLEFHDDSVRPSSNTFPLHSRNPSPRPPLHGHGGQPESIPHSGSLPLRLQEAMNSNRGSSRGLPQQPMRPPDPEIFDEQGMDSAWYVGQVSRAQAEGNLRHVNRDGAFLVRDSSKGSAAQPYTLMVLFQGKVFNIQIRKEQHGYILGTGLKSSERFTTVGDIIRQHTQMPLLLIDAKNRGSGQQNQCALTHPAGF